MGLFAIPIPVLYYTKKKKAILKLIYEEMNCLNTSAVNP